MRSAPSFPQRPYLGFLFRCYSEPKFGQEFANIIRRRLPRPGDKWHMDEVVLKIAGKTHHLWRPSTSTASCLMSWSRAGAEL